jgi:CI-like repressor, S. pneumoniae bacteriophage EJ-1
LSIGSRIKERRSELKLSRNDLAYAIGVSPSAIANYENEISVPKIELMYKIFSVLKCDANYLYQDDMTSTTKGSVMEEPLLNKYRQLDEHGKELVSLVIDKEYERIEISKKQKNKNTSLIQENISNYEIPLCQYPYILGGASAGLTSFLTDIEIESIKAPICEGADFIISVSGDSMEPSYYDGEKVYVQKTPELNLGDIGIFSRGNELFIKEYGEDGLISHNPKYKMIKGTEDIQTVGRVIGKVEL